MGTAIQMEAREARPGEGFNENALAGQVRRAVERFRAWLDQFGEFSWDHQSFYAGPLGRRAKRLYYRQRWLGTIAVAPMVACEAFVPGARRLFHRPTRFPIADAHYAMGFLFLYRESGDASALARAKAFLEVLKETRCHEYKEYCWGYPFDWVTRNGILRAGTPFITSTPYVFEAFEMAYRIERKPEWHKVLESIARHASTDIRAFAVSARASSCAYYPGDEQGGVVNAAAYRACLLTRAAVFFSRNDLLKPAERNIQFVLESQNEDGSWFYALDGVRDFVDHYHTCFVMKALAKIHAITGDAEVLGALKRGVEFYLAQLFAGDGLPRPFARAPRLTVYQRELYDCAECVNLCLLLRDRFPALEGVLRRVVEGVLRDWVKPDGSFRSRKLMWGWDDVPMHRWGQAQMFRSLAYWLDERRESEGVRAPGKG